MKKLLIFLTVILMLGTYACAEETASATAEGFGGDITVTIIVKDGTLTEIVIDGPSETSGIGSRAINC
jgi:Na+-translocating ferredoxin:NAD+ oxidoreductase RnfG subunit